MGTNFEDQYSDYKNKPLSVDPPPGGWDKITNVLDEHKEPKGNRSKIGYYTILLLLISCVFIWIVSKQKMKKGQRAFVTSGIENVNQEVEDLTIHRENNSKSTIKNHTTITGAKGSTKLAISSNSSLVKTTRSAAIKPQKGIQSDDRPSTIQQENDVYTFTTASIVSDGSQENRGSEINISVAKNEDENLKQRNNKNHTVSDSDTKASNKQYEASISRVLGSIPVLDLRVMHEYQYPMKTALVIDPKKTNTRSHKWRVIASMGTPLSTIVTRDNSSFLATSATSPTPDASMSVLTLTREGQPIYIDPSTVDTLSLTNFNPSFNVEIRRFLGTKWEVGFGATYLDINSLAVDENPAQFGPGLVYRSIESSHFNILTNLTLNYNFKVGKLNPFVGTQLHFNLYEQDITTINITEYGLGGNHVSINSGYRKWNPTFIPTPSISFGLNYDITRRLGIDGGIQFIPINGSLDVSRTWWRMGCYVRFQ